MTSVLLLKQSKFSSDILVTNAAYEVALAIREAQVYGISSKQTTSNTNVAYGVNFNNSSSNAFTIYSDSGDGGNPIKYPFNYNGGAAICGSSEYCPIDNPMLTQGQTIKKICVDSDCSITSLNIGFIKPNPEAVIHDSTSYTLNRGSAIIVIASALGDKCRVVRVTSIGQISVDAPVSSGSDCDQTK